MGTKKRKVAWNRVFGVIGGLMAIWLVAAGASYMFFSGGGSSKGTPKPDVQSTPVSSAEQQLNDRVEEILGQMSETEKIGQLIMIGIQGTEADEDNLYMFTQFHFGGVILFDRNMQDMEQVAALTKELQAKCEEKVPLFVAIDEEGGDVARMKDVLDTPKSQLDIARNGNPQDAKKSAYDISQQLKKMGFNVNFAPVADLGSTNGSRHFSDDPDKASKYVLAAASGYKDAGLLFTLKHFPGIGRGEEDTHYSSVSVDVSRQKLMAEDVLPFRNAISNHSPNDFLIMVSHVTYPQVSGDTPASVSPAIMKDMLRNELGFKGVIVTDDMEMGAIANDYGYRRSALEAVLAGADMVLMCHEYEHEIDAYMGIYDALHAGEITQDRIDDSVRRILRVKLSNLVKE